MEFSEYIIYVDESGDHNLLSNNPNYPIFSLAFCIFKKADYLHNVVPRIQELKFNWFGHDAYVLHEREIRKREAPFNAVGSKEQHTAFLKEIGKIVADAPMTVVASVIDKDKHKAQYVDPANPYSLALQFCMERTTKFLQEQGQDDKLTHIVVEKRGLQEDKDLELEFRRICDGANYLGRIDCLDMLFVDKKANSSGLQLADLVARPIGLSVLKPDQPNRAFDVIKTKLRCNGNGKYDGFGLKIFP